jgi:hypothetical protein
MNALLTPEMAVWAPEDALSDPPEHALAAADHKAAKLGGIVLAVAVMSVLAATVLSLFPIAG